MEQPGLAEGVLACGMGVETRWSVQSFPTQTILWFYGSIITFEWGPCPHDPCPGTEVLATVSVLYTNTLVCTMTWSECHLCSLRNVSHWEDKTSVRRTLLASGWSPGGVLKYNFGLQSVYSLPIWEHGCLSAQSVHSCNLRQLVPSWSSQNMKTEKTHLSAIFSKSLILSLFSGIACCQHSRNTLTCRTWPSVLWGWGRRDCRGRGIYLRKVDMDNILSASMGSCFLR